MIWHWLVYLGSVIGCIIFFVAYQQWFSWFILVGALCLPVVSLLVSLPGMLGMVLEGQDIAAVSVGTKVPVIFTEKSRFPAPRCKYRVRLTRVTTGESWSLKNGELLPTEHCGKLICRPEKARVYDYLGLFWLKIQKKTAMTVVVRPLPVTVAHIPELEQYTATAWRPKAGGGFSENHELRLYRPGDKLNQIHWKLSAKTGKMIVREPMEPQGNRIILEMELRGTGQVLDQKFGQLLWLSEHLLQMGLPHELRVLTGRGTCCLAVSNAAELEQNLDALLGEPQAPEGQKLEPISAFWRYRVGGGEANV